MERVRSFYIHHREFGGYRPDHIVGWKQVNKSIWESSSGEWPNFRRSRTGREVPIVMYLGWRAQPRRLCALPMLGYYKVLDRYQTYA